MIAAFPETPRGEGTSVAESGSPRIPAPSRMVVSASGPGACAGPDFSFVDLGDSARLALMLTPRAEGSLRDQAQQILARLEAILKLQTVPMQITVQTIFLRYACDQAECEQILRAFYGGNPPVTNYVLQPPCAGAALALEAWAIGGASVRVERFGANTLAVAYDSVRWVYCAGIDAPGMDQSPAGVYSRASAALEQMGAALAKAGSGFDRVVRTWFYLGGITEKDGSDQRYQELNRARSNFYKEMSFGSGLIKSRNGRGVFPASTGIGTSGSGLVLGCMALETRREDLFLVALENPRQTPAYAYASQFSPQSPKFARAIALRLGNYVTTWISGTASIVHSESCHPGDAQAQTEETITNIERLISPENFVAHGVHGAGARLQDLAKIRVYLKRPEDFERCKAISDRRFGPVPAVYAVADICRPELLVEIEGVAFSRYAPQA